MNKIYLILAFVLLSAAVFSIQGMTSKLSPVEKEIETELDIGEELFTDGVHLKAIQHIMAAQNLAHKADAREWECLAFYNLGVCYFYLCQYGEALDNFQKAYDIDIELSKSRSRKEVSKNIGIKILNGIAGVFFEQQQFEKSRQFVDNAYRLALEKNDREMILTLSGDMVLINNKEKNFEEADKYLEIARRYAQDDCANRAALNTYEAETRFEQKDYPEVISLASSVIGDSCASQDNKGLMMTYLINIYSESGNFEKALSFEKDAIALSSFKNKDYLFQSLSEMYKRYGKLSKALEMKDSMILYHDSAINVNNQRLLHGANTKIEIMRYKAESEKHLAMIHQRYILWGAGVCILILILIITLIAINRQKIKIKHNNQITQMKFEKEQKEKLLAEERMRETELIANLQKETLKKEIELKRRELAASAMFVDSRNELIRDISSQLEVINGKYKIEEIANLNRNLYQKLRTYNNEENLMTGFEAADPGFAKKLLEKHPELLPSDIKFLSYVKMNISTKDIALLLNIAPDSCKRRKNRLSKKLRLEDSSCLFAYLTRF